MKTNRSFLIAAVVLLVAACLFAVLTACGSAEPTTGGNTPESRQSAENSSGKTPAGASSLPATEHVHDFGEWIIVKEASCVEEGLRERACACGEKESESIPAAGHKAEIDGAVAPTCTEMGKTEGSHCSVCGAVIASQEVLPALGHDYVDRVCTRCQAVEPSEGLECVMYDDEYGVVGIGYCTDELVVVPARFQSYPIVQIEEGAFEQQTQITELIVSEGIRRIDKSAFLGCSGIKKASIPSSVALLGEEAFAYCNSLEEIVMENGVKAFGDAVFIGCSRLGSIVLPDSLISIGSWTFTGCESLESIALGSDLQSIGGMSFAYLPALQKITVAAGNETYHSSENCLIKTKEKQLITGCRTSVLPDDGSVTSIGDEAFQSCYGLTSVNIPLSVTSIGIGAFNGCSNLKTVRYAGSEEQWKQIIINDYNEELLNAEIVFSSNG